MKRVQSLSSLLGDYYKGIVQGMKKKEKNTQKNTKSTLGWNLLMLVGILMILFAGYNLIKIYLDYHESDQLYDNLNQEYVKKTEEKKTEETQQEMQQWYEMANVDLAGVREQNPDVVGWIYFENEDISYPILYSGDDAKYLRTTLDGANATAGSIFMEGENNPDFEDSHTIIYGHNMKNLSMFGKLKYYKKDDYYDDHAYFQIFTDNNIYRYQIFAYEDIDADSEVYSVPFGDNNEFQNFIDSLYRKSYRDTGVTATSGDKIITLSTCSDEDKRFVIHAVRVEEHVR